MVIRAKMEWGEYVPRCEEEIAMRGLLARPSNGIARAILVEGPPGCGKTSLAEIVARSLQAETVFHQLHAWSGDEDLFRGVDVGAAVAGDSEHVHQDGVLARVARLSSDVDRWVVVCLDEIDKAPDRTEALLLDWLQSGRVPVRPGEHLVTQFDRVIVVITSNATRPLSDALQRRVRRVAMRPLSGEVAVGVITRKLSCPAGVARLTWRALCECAQADGTVPSVQEGNCCVQELSDVAESCDDVRLIVAGWGPRGDAGRQAAAKSKLPEAIWAEVKKWRSA
jgi:DNA polymerase III delta prime subunit